MVIALWAEQGSFRGLQVCLLFFDLAVYRNIKLSILTFAGPVYALIKRDMTWFQRTLTGLEIINGFGQVVAIIPMLIFARDEDPGNYNVAAVAYLFLFPLGMIATIIFMIFQTAGLKKSIAKLTRALEATSTSPGNDKLIKFQKRLHLVVLLNVSLFSTTVPLLAFPIVILVLGSFPGQYILLSCVHIFLPLFCIGASIILRREKDEQSRDVTGTAHSSSKHVLPDSQRIVVASLNAGSSS
jgi:hypothetical protein